MSRVLVIPVKAGRDVKSRLSPWLTADERAELLQVMLEDVAAAVDRSRGGVRKLIVSSAAWAAAFARRRGWELLAESGQTSESESVDGAMQQLALAGAAAALRVPADLPLATPGDFDQLWDMPLPSPGAVLVPSRDQGGTNALLRSPPSAFPSRFGPDSLRLHQDEARRAGIPVRVVYNPRLALDIDTVEDILTLERSRADVQTMRFLHSRGIVDRIRERRRSEADAAT